MQWKSLRRFALALLAGVAFTASADAPKATSQAPVPLLWKVSDKDNSVYLLGSFHLLRENDYPLSKDVEAAFADAESLMFELPPESMNSADVTKQMMSAALRRDGSKLKDEVDADTWTRLQAWATRNGIPIEGLAAFEPWFVAMSISITEMMHQKLDPKLGLDAHFMAQAKSAGKPTAGLERVEDQITLLDGMDALEQRQFLKEALEEAEKGSAQTEKVHRAWRNGDAKLLWDEMTQQLKIQYPNLYQRINVERNDNWVPKIEQRLQAPGTDDTLIVVGAIHLLGSDGVVEKLRARGYTVERICSACKTR